MMKKINENEKDEMNTVGKKSLVHILPPMERKISGHLDVLDDLLVYVSSFQNQPWKFSNESEEVREVDIDAKKDEEFIQFLKTLPTSPNRHHLDSINSSDDLKLEKIDNNKRFNPFFTCSTSTRIREIEDTLKEDPIRKVAIIKLGGKIPDWIMYGQDKIVDLLDKHREIQKERIIKLRNNGLDMQTINYEQARNREILRQLHQEWLLKHAARIDEVQERKAELIEKRQEEIIKSTSEDRREEKRILLQKLNHNKSVRQVVSSILMSTIAGLLYRSLTHSWTILAQKKMLLRYAKHWKQRAIELAVKRKSSNLLQNWLYHDVGLKKLSGKFYYGFRKYLRNICLIQQLWRRKQKIKERRFQVLNKLFVEINDKNIKEYEEQIKNERRESRRHSSVKGNHVVKQEKTKHTQLKPTSIPEPVKCKIILEYLESQYRKFRQERKEYDELLWPHFVQTLYVEYENMNRFQVRKMADKYRKLGTMYAKLCTIPGSLIGFDKYPTIEIMNAPVNDLIKKAEEVVRLHEGSSLLDVHVIPTTIDNL